MRVFDLALVLVALAVPAIAQGPPPDGGASRRPERYAMLADSATAPLNGIWVSDTDPNGFLMISAGGDRVVNITAGKRFVALGWFLDGRFDGVWRSPGQAWEPRGPYEFGGLRFALTGAGEIRAQFSDVIGSRPTREEIWRRVSAPDEPPVRGPDAHAIPDSTRPRGFEPDAHAVPDGSGLPRFGEFVYVEELPEVLDKTSPRYPKAAREAGIEGTVIVQALVGRDGLVKDVRVTKPIPGLSESAIDAVRKWRFKPAKSKGASIAVWVAVPVKFTLR